MNKKQILHPAVFLDRDGTITPEAGYVIDPDKLELLPGAADAIKRLGAAGFKVIVITNQSAVARGMMNISTLEKLNGRFRSLLEGQGAPIDGLYYCPHHPTEGDGEYTRPCDCRKPATGMFIKAAGEQSIDLSKSYIIGDKLSDISMAPALRAKGILVKTGYGESEMELLSSSNDSLHGSDFLSKPDYIARDISDAAGWIILQSR
jgi:D-glycero-D-manno-heptose 1,7-bisphosphate phosphatase